MSFDPDANNNGTNGDGMDQLSMEELVEMSVQTLREGEVVSGTVVAVDDDGVMIDIGFKSEGIIPAQEFRDRATGEITANVGDEIDVFIERLDEAEGLIRLSRDRAARLQIWKAIEQAYKNEQPVEGKVIERVKGGLSVDIGVRAFLPGSLVDLRPNRRLEDYIGQDISARIINFDRRRSNVVLSRKAILEEEQSVAKEATLEDLEEGGLMTGVVKNITDYGVFIDLGGIDGLLHITDISWGRVGHPNEYFEVGDEVDVVILKFDRDKERVSLGYKQRFEDPWTLVPEKYPIGKRVSGKVVSIVDYGAFVELEEGVEGLIHVSEMSWTKKVKNPRSMVEIDQEVDVVVSEVDPDKRRLSLSLRATEPNPWETVAETYTIGSEIHGIVRNLTDFGAFVEIVPGVDGLVHISDMSWTRRIQHPSDVVQKGQEIDAVITSIDVVNQRISLSMKELMPNEWEEYANSHRVGDETRGTVTNITDFGLFIELAPGVEGLCHISEIDRDPSQSLADEYSVGQEVGCRILRIDWNDNRIGLSMHGIGQDDTEGAEPSAGAVGAGSAAAAAAAAPPESQTAMAQALARGGVIAEEPQVDADSAAEAEEADQPEEEAEPTVVSEEVEATSGDGESDEDREEATAAEESEDTDATDQAEEDDASPEPASESAADEDEAPSEEPATESAADEDDTDEDTTDEDRTEDESEPTGATASDDLLKDLEDQIATGGAPEEPEEDA